MSVKEEAWKSWLTRAENDAEERLAFAKKRIRKEQSARDWLKGLRSYLNQLSRIGILQPQEQARLTLLGQDELPAADKTRLEKDDLLNRIQLIGIGKPSGSEKPLRLRDRVLVLSPGKKLSRGTLRIMAFIDTTSKAVAGMSIQVEGKDPASKKGIFGRYDLDIVSLGSSQVTHFDAHFHFGEDPSDEEAPRWPTLFLDPEEALDVLLHTWFPNGPKDVLPLQGERGYFPSCSSPVPSVRAAIHRSRMMRRSKLARARAVAWAIRMRSRS